MRLLRGFVLVLEFAELNVSLTEHCSDRLVDVGLGGLAQAYAVGTHISDVPVLVKPLCDLHGTGHTVTEFSGSLLLKGRGGKWRGRRTLAGFHLNVGYFIVGADASR